MKIALDVFGGDNAPDATINGAFLALKLADKHGMRDFSIALVGDKQKILDHLGEDLPDQIEIVDAQTDLQTDKNDPVADGEASESAIRIALRRHARGEFDAVVSAGSTGAQVMGSLLELEKTPGITRPAVGAVLPTVRGFSFLLDVGASLVASPHHLVQFAALGHVYASEILGMSNPSIGVINVGSENSVGDRSAVAAHSLLSESGFNFIGFVEGRDIPKGLADVLVTNGLIGNVLLKYTEGLPVLFKKLLPAKVFESVQKQIEKQLDYQSYGGEPLLGVKGTSIICHGASSDKAIAAAIMQAEKIASIKLFDKIETFLTDHFDSYFSQVRFLRSFRRSLRTQWRSPRKPPESESD